MNTVNNATFSSQHTAPVVTMSFPTPTGLPPTDTEETLLERVSP